MSPTSPYSVSTLPANEPPGPYPNSLASFPIQFSGFPAGSLVYAEQCDGEAPTAPGYDVVADCDSATQTAGVTASASGTGTFPAYDPAFGFYPFEGTSPDGLFGCYSPYVEPSPGSSPTWSNCQLRLSTNPGAVTPGDAYITLTLPDMACPGALDGIACDNVAPYQGLTDGQTISVLFDNFPTPGPVYVLECTPLVTSPTIELPTCSTFNVTQAAITHSDPVGLGGGTTNYVVHTLPNPAQPHDITCNASSPCSIVVSTSPAGFDLPPGDQNPYFDVATIKFAAPPTVVPEAPWAGLLPFTAFVLLGLAVWWTRRRRHAN